MATHNKQTLLGFFEDLYHTMPQKSALAAGAIEAIFSGLTTLAGLGHSFMLRDAEPEDHPKPVEFPKMMYSNKGTMVVHSAKEEGEATLQGYSTTQGGE